MFKLDPRFLLPACLALLISSPVLAGAQPDLVDACRGFGPQTPRDIDAKQGENLRIFSLAPSSEQMNLCNIHFHKHAEHKGAAFSIPAGDGDDHGVGGGFKCAMGEELSDAEKAPYQADACHGLKPGDTLEVHWVHSSCDIEPGPTLGSCLDAERCFNPQLRVETQVFVLVNDRNAANFADFDFEAVPGAPYRQPKALPTGTGDPVLFTGSTTGPSFNEVCSPFQVTWSVRPQCAKLDIASVAEWCKDNVFDEDHAHGVRKLVTDPALLSKIP